MNEPEEPPPHPVHSGEAPPPAELAHLAEQLGTARAPLDVFRALREFIEAVTGNNALFVSLLDETHQWRRCVYAWSDGAEVDVSELPLLPVSGSASPNARAVATGEVVITSDLMAALADSPNVALGYERDARAPNISVALPLTILGNVIGGFEVQMINHPDPGSCVPSLQVGANLAAAAIENLRLLETERELRQAAEASERRYRASEQRLRLALEAAGLGTWEYAIDEDRVSWSPPTDFLVGRPDGAPPRTWSELLELADADDRAHVAEVLAAALQGPGTREVEFRLAGQHGTSRWLTCRVHTILDASGTPVRLVGVVLDITTRKEAEQQRHALARAEQLRALGQMASGIVHDLNQSLALISGYGELARDALSGGGPELPEITRMVDMVVRSAQDGARTLKQLLAFARSSQTEEVEIVDVAALLREVAQLTAPRWHSASQGIRLEVDVPADTELLVSASRSALREALTNLIFNAVDALGDGGLIRLRGAHVDGRVIAEVSDTGPGIPPELQERIFEPFFTTKGERGTGLGLAQVKGMVARYGGELVLESAPSRGTIFRISLPRAVRAVEVRPEVQHAIRQAVAARRVLAVDDEAKLRTMIAHVLRGDGHQTTLAASGEEALRLLETEEPFDLVLSDISMGSGMSGWELAERVHKRWPNLPVVLASGWGAQIDPKEARARGVAAVLAKPFRVRELRETVASLTAPD